MLRRHLSPAIVAFLLLLLACAGSAPAVGVRWPAALAAAAVTAAGAAAAAAAGARRQGSRGVASRAALLLGAAAAGLLLGGASLLRMERAAARDVPLAPWAVTSWTGTLTADSTLSRQGDTVLRVALVGARSGGAGISVSRARAAVLVFLRGGHRFAMGQRVEVRSALSPWSSPYGPERLSAAIDRAALRVAGWSSPAWEARARAREWLHRSVSLAGYPASALMEALLVGSREDVPQALSDDFRLSGSLHILALSGLHVTALYGAVALLLGFVRSRAAKFVLATAVLAGYQALAGFLPSLLRATVMIVVGGTAHMLDRDAEPLNVLALSGIVLLAIDPFAAFSVSFQLSFLAMAGILVIGPVVERPLEGILPRAVRVPLAMAIGAQAGTLPVVIAAFGAWYPSGIPAGLLLVPLTTVLLWAGVAWLPISALPLPALHEAGSRVLGALYAAVEQVAAFFARAPGVAFPSPAATWAAAAAAVLLAAAMLVLPWRPRGPQLPTGRPA